MLITKVSQLKHGMKVKCEIGGTHIDDARIQITDSGTIYICQNLMGYSFSDKPFGYTNLWTIADEDGWDSTFQKTVKNLRTAEKTSLSELEAGDIVIDKYGDKYKILAVAGEVCLLSYRNGFDVASYWCTFKELEKGGYKILQEESEAEQPEEMRLAEIEKALGKKIKIVD